MAMRDVEEASECVCRLSLFFDDSPKPASGTGFLVNIPESNKFCIMTAAHNIVAKNVGKVMRIEAHFGKGLKITAKREECFASQVFENDPADNSAHDSSFFDYGLIAVDRTKYAKDNFPGGCAFSIFPRGHELLGPSISVHGYKQGEEKQTVNASELDYVNNELLFYTKETLPGVSGGPAFIYSDGPTAIGIHVYASRAIRLTCAVLLEMLSWVNDYPLRRTLEVSAFGANKTQGAGVYLRATNGSEPNIVARPGRDSLCYLNFVLAEAPKETRKSRAPKARASGKSEGSYLVLPPQPCAESESVPRVLAVVRESDSPGVGFYKETHCEREEIKINISFRGPSLELWFPGNRVYLEVVPSKRSKHCEFGCITQDQQVLVSSKQGSRFRSSNYKDAQNDGPLDTSNSLSPLYRAVLERNYGNVRDLVQQNVDINLACECGTTALSKAAEKGYLDIVSLLLDKQARLETVNRDGESPTQLAVHNGHTNVIVRFQYYTDDRTEALLEYALQGSLAEVQRLLETGLPVDSRYRGRATSALDAAAEKGHTTIVDYLLRDAKANASGADDRRVTPLHRAAENGHASVIKLLKEFGADPNVFDNDDMTPLHRTADKGHIEPAVELCSGSTPTRANLDARGPNDRTPLMLAARYCQSKMVAQLLELGARADLVDARGNTAKDIAEESGWDDIYDLLP